MMLYVRETEIAHTQNKYHNTIFGMYIRMPNWKMFQHRDEIVYIYYIIVIVEWKDNAITQTCAPFASSPSIKCTHDAHASNTTIYVTLAAGIWHPTFFCFFFAQTNNVLFRKDNQKHIISSTKSRTSPVQVTINETLEFVNLCVRCDSALPWLSLENFLPK